MESKPVRIARQSITANEHLDADQDFRKRSQSLPVSNVGSLIIKTAKMGGHDKSVSLEDVFSEEMVANWDNDSRFKKFDSDSRSYEIDELLLSKESEKYQEIATSSQDLKHSQNDASGASSAAVNIQEQHFEEDTTTDEEVARIIKTKTRNVFYGLHDKARAWDESNQVESITTETPVKRKITSPEQGTPPIIRRRVVTSEQLGTPRVARRRCVSINYGSSGERGKAAPRKRSHTNNPTIKQQNLIIPLLKRVERKESVRATEENVPLVNDIPNESQ